MVLFRALLLIAPTRNKGFFIGIIGFLSIRETLNKVSLSTGI